MPFALNEQRQVQIVLVCLSEKNIVYAQSAQNIIENIKAKTENCHKKIVSLARGTRNKEMSSNSHNEILSNI